MAFVSITGIFRYRLNWKYRDLCLENQSTNGILVVFSAC